MGICRFEIKNILFHFRLTVTWIFRQFDDSLNELRLAKELDVTATVIFSWQMFRIQLSLKKVFGDLLSICCVTFIYFLFYIQKIKIKYFFAFAFNAKSFAIAILAFFYFFLLVTFSGRTAKSFLANVLTLLIKKACDQDLNHSLDTSRNISRKIVPQIVIRNACGTWNMLLTVTSIHSIQKNLRNSQKIGKKLAS